VANVEGSIQLLEKEHTRLSSTSLGSEIARVYQLDNDKITRSSSKDRKDVNLPDMETMKTVANHRIKPNEHNPSFTPRFLCASIDRPIAVLCVRHLDGF